MSKKVKINIVKSYERKKRRATELFCANSPFRPKIVPDKTKGYKRDKRIDDGY